MAEEKESRLQTSGTIGESASVIRERPKVVSEDTSKSLTPLATQVGGSHYKKYKIQPIEFCQLNGLNQCESNVVKYITRWRDKDGLQDLLKAKHMIDLLIEIEGLTKDKPTVSSTVECDVCNDDFIYCGAPSEFCGLNNN